MKVYSIGFTQTTAKMFFETVKNVGIQRLIDVRLNNVSQLAGFAKRDDLAFFLKNCATLITYTSHYWPQRKIFLMDIKRTKVHGWSISNVFLSS